MSDQEYNEYTRVCEMIEAGYSPEAIEQSLVADLRSRDASDIAIKVAVEGLPAFITRIRNQRRDRKNRDIWETRIALGVFLACVSLIIALVITRPEKQAFYDALPRLSLLEGLSDFASALDDSAASIEYHNFLLFSAYTGKSRDGSLQIIAVGAFSHIWDLYWDKESKSSNAVLLFVLGGAVVLAILWIGWVVFYYATGLARRSSA